MGAPHDCAGQARRPPSGVPSRSWMQAHGLAERLVNDPCAIGQDAATVASLLRVGHAKVSTVVNRVGYIGRTGTHVNPSVLFEHRLDEFSEDAAPWAEANGYATLHNDL